MHIWHQRKGTLVAVLHTCFWKRGAEDIYTMNAEQILIYPMCATKANFPLLLAWAGGCIKG